MAATIFLKASGLKPISRGHLWVFPSAVAKVRGNPLSGQVVKVADPKGDFIAWGWYNPASGIRVRLLDRNGAAEIGRDWLTARLEASLLRRQRLLDDPATTAFRLAHAEADGLPGLIVDRYGEVVVAQFLSAGAEMVKDEVAAWLDERFKPSCIYERSDSEPRRLEGLPQQKGVLRGAAPEGLVGFKENGSTLVADVTSGPGSGYYLIQRDNRRLVAGYAPGLRVLDGFSYSGGFSVQALAAGASSSVLVDSSAKALTLARANLRANGLDQPADLVQGNLFDILGQYREARRAFDLIILDPPAFAPTRALVNKAVRAYKELNLLALKLLPSGGILATFSSSSSIEPGFFQEILLWAAQEAGCQIQIAARLGQPEDHPVLVGFPESESLKGLVCRKV